MSCGLTESGIGSCWGDSRFGPEFHTALADKTWLDLSIGVDRVCGISTENQSYCWVRQDTEYPLALLRTHEPTHEADHQDESMPIELEEYSWGEAQSLFTGINQSCLIRLDGTSQCVDHRSQMIFSNLSDGLIRQWSIGDQTRCMLKSDLTLECRGQLLVGQPEFE
jgi:hypothetical protein